MAPLSPFGANVDAHTRKSKGELTNETGPRKLEHVTIHEKDKNSTVIEQVTITPIPTILEVTRGGGRSGPRVLLSNTNSQNQARSTEGIN